MSQQTAFNHLQTNVPTTNKCDTNPNQRSELEINFINDYVATSTAVNVNNNTFNARVARSKSVDADDTDSFNDDCSNRESFYHSDSEVSYQSTNNSDKQNNSQNASQNVSQNASQNDSQNTSESSNQNDSEVSQQNDNEAPSVSHNNEQNDNQNNSHNDNQAPCQSICNENPVTIDTSNAVDELLNEFENNDIVKWFDNLENDSKPDNKAHDKQTFEFDVCTFNKNSDLYYKHYIKEHTKTAMITLSDVASNLGLIQSALTLTSNDSKNSIKSDTITITDAIDNRELFNITFYTYNGDDVKSKDYDIVARVMCKKLDTKYVCQYSYCALIKQLYLMMYSEKCSKCDTHASNKLHDEYNYNNENHLASHINSHVDCHLNDHIDCHEDCHEDCHTNYDKTHHANLHTDCVDNHSNVLFIKHNVLSALQKLYQFIIKNTYSASPNEYAHEYEHNAISKNTAVNINIKFADTTEINNCAMEHLNASYEITSYFNAYFKVNHSDIYNNDTNGILNTFKKIYKHFSYEIFVASIMAYTGYIG
jgi:hypothetical protein